MVTSIEKTALRLNHPPGTSRLQISDLPGIDDRPVLSIGAACTMYARLLWPSTPGSAPMAINLYGAYREIHLFGCEDAPGTDYQNLTLELQLPITKGHPELTR